MIRIPFTQPVTQCYAALYNERRGDSCVSVSAHPSGLRTARHEPSWGNQTSTASGASMATQKPSGQALPCSSIKEFQKNTEKAFFYLLLCGVAYILGFQLLERNDNDRKNRQTHITNIFKSKIYF